MALNIFVICNIEEILSQGILSYLFLVLGDFVLGDFILRDSVLWDFVQK